MIMHTTRPRVHDLYEFIRERAGRPVTFFEARAAFPYYRSGDIRTQVNKLVTQGYVIRHDRDTYEWNSKVFQ